MLLPPPPGGRETAEQLDTQLIVHALSPLEKLAKYSNGVQMYPFGNNRLLFIMEQCNQDFNPNFVLAELTHLGPKLIC